MSDNNYWCHECQLNIRPGPDLLCPHCAGGFIEAGLPEVDYQNGFEIGDDEGAEALIEPLQMLLQNLMAAEGLNLRGQEEPEEQNEGEDLENGRREEEEEEEEEEISEEDEEFEESDEEVDFRLPPGYGLLQFLSQLRAGQIGDYVIGNQGLDNVISRLMEQEAAKVKNPAPNEVIGALPSSKVLQKHIEDKAECPVCRDEYQLEETLTELPCHHFFHKDCIEPWLQVNGNCPVCRLSLLPEEPKAQQEAASAPRAIQAPSRAQRIGRLPNYQNPPEFFQQLLQGNGNGNANAHGNGIGNGPRSRPTSRQNSNSGQEPPPIQGGEAALPEVALPEAPLQQKLELQELAGRMEEQGPEEASRQACSPSLIKSGSKEKDD